MTTPKPKLDQATFDEAVATNKEDFDLEHDEAVQSALKEFKVQGYDTSMIVTTSGGESIEQHAINLALIEVERLTDEPAACEVALQHLLKSLSDSDAFSDQETAAVTHAIKALPRTLVVCKKLAKEPVAATLVLQVLCALLKSQEARDAFTEAGGPELMIDLFRSNSNERVQLGAAQAAELACWKVEDVKCRFVDLGFTKDLLAVLEREDCPSDMITAACGALRALVTADDMRPPTSKAFLHARMLASNDNAMKVMLRTLKQQAEHPKACATVMAAIRQLSVNDDICKEFAEAGGVATIMNILRSTPGDASLALAGCSALRQLGNSDTVKSLLAETGGLPLLLSLVHNHIGNEDLVQSALGVLVNMTLRMPNVSSAAAEAGTIDVVVETMVAQQGSARVQQQACMLVRNMVVRNVELRPLYLERGVETLLRAAKAAHQKSCKDVASAALRDLGLDNYND